MCSSPSIPTPKAPPPVYAPPPPSETARVAENKSVRSRSSGRKRGLSSLTVRRSQVNTGSSGTGANMNA